MICMATIQMRDKADRPFCGNTSYIITPMSCRKATGYCSRKITIQYIDRERDTVQSIKKLPNFSSTEKVREIIHLGPTTPSAFFLQKLQYLIGLLKPTSFCQADSTALGYSVQTSCWPGQQKGEHIVPK